MRFKEKLFNLVQEQKVEDINKVLIDMSSILCATLYLNSSNAKDDLKKELLKNIGEIWEETTEIIGKKHENIELQENR